MKILTGFNGTWKKALKIRLKHQKVWHTLAKSEIKLGEGTSLTKNQVLF